MYVRIAYKVIKYGWMNVNVLQDENTPLHLASENGQRELVEILAKAGADVTIINKVS